MVLAEVTSISTNRPFMMIRHYISNVVKQLGSHSSMFVCVCGMFRMCAVSCRHQSDLRNAKYWRGGHSVWMGVGDE